MNIIGGKNQTTCHETCQKLEDSKNKIIVKPVKKISQKIKPTIIPETMTLEDCNKICTNLWKNNNQEKTNCMVSCTNEIIK